MCWDDEEKIFILENICMENLSCSFPHSSILMLNYDKKQVYIKKIGVENFILGGDKNIVEKLRSIRLYQTNNKGELLIHLQLFTLLDDIKQAIDSFGDNRDNKKILDDYWGEIDKLSNTERKTWLSKRLGQDRLRDFLLKTTKACVITGITQRELLIASHIKPWRDCCFNKAECLDPENILLLAKNYDAFFDAALITFSSNDGSLVVSKLVSAEDLKKMGIDSAAKLPNISAKRSEYLKWHNRMLKDKETKILKYNKS